MNSQVSEKRDDQVESDEMKEVLVAKAHELYELCDKEGKGFITKRDMQRLQEELALSPEQLEEVFDTLDEDSNGYLTLEEFTEGFGMFTGVDTLSLSPEKKAKVVVEEPVMDLRRYSSCLSNSVDMVIEESEDEQFYAMLENLGAQDLFQDDNDEMKNIWRSLKKDDRDMVAQFEGFLGQVITELRKTRNDFSQLETVLKSRSSVHDEQVRRLYEEMEQLMENDRTDLLTEERTKERKKREELEIELQEKNTQLQELVSRQNQMESEFKNLNVLESEAKQKNAKLEKERNELEKRLFQSEQMLNEMQKNLDILRQNDISEKRYRLKTVLKVSEGIALEREGLVKQLDMLRSVNKQLLDEQDCLILNGQGIQALDFERIPSIKGSRPSSMNSDPEIHEPTIPPHPPPNRSAPDLRRGSTMSDYIEELSLPVPLPKEGNSFYKFNPFLRNNAVDYEVDDTYFPPVNGNSPPFSLDEKSECNSMASGSGSTGSGNWNDKRLNKSSVSQSNNTRQSSPLSGRVSPNYRSVSPLHFTEIPLNGSPMGKGQWKVKRTVYSDTDGDTQEIWKMKLRYFPAVNSTRSDDSSYLSTVGSDRSDLSDVSSNPERIFKVVFIGDSSVGKSSFIHRFCHNDFRPSFSATIGVDFQVKSINLDGHVIAVQVWDTAGQERFRSVTKQYYRKADGVIVMYDVTSEISFRSVRSWMNDVKEGADESTVLMLLGNKIDLCVNDGFRVIKHKDGQNLADEYGTLFYETSAKTSEAVEDAMRAMAELLQQREDENIEKALRLKDTIKKRKCCKS